MSLIVPGQVKSDSQEEFCFLSQVGLTEFVLSNLVHIISSYPWTSGVILTV